MNQNSLFIKYFGDSLDDPGLEVFINSKTDQMRYSPYERIVIAAMVAQGIILEQVHESISLLEASIDETNIELSKIRNLINKESK